MADLRKWFPFKFKRTEDKAESSQAPLPVKQSPATLAPSMLMQGFPEVGRMMERMFSEPFYTRPTSLLGELDRFFGDFSPTTFSPSVDLVDEGKNVKVSAELPGLDKDDIDISVHEGTLILRGHKKHEEETREEGCYRTERYFGSFQRTIPLPADVDLEQADARFDKGVLTVRFPKTEHGGEQPQRITVS